jgi:dihydroxyacetone kinase-like protein
MQKFVNDPAEMVLESMEGFAKCNSDIVYLSEKPNVMFSKSSTEGRVAVVTGGGAGHDPAMYGYVGENMLDAAVVGEIFTTPLVKDFYYAFKKVNSGKGVACLFGNYKNDRKNVEEAIRLAEKDGVKVKCVIAQDDVATDEENGKRGLAGEILMWKVGCAAAMKGYNLDSVIGLAQKAIDNTKSIGVGLSSCIIPTVGRPNYLIEEGTMEIGIGHHGTASRDTCKLKTADAIADIMMNSIFSEMPLSRGDEVVVLLSGMGNTILMELNILYNRVYDILMEKNVKIHRSFVGNYFTSLDMMGATISIMKLDDQLKKLIDMPVKTAAIR